MQKSIDSDYLNSNHIFSRNVINDGAFQTLNFDQRSFHNFSEEAKIPDENRVRKFDVDVSNDPILREYNHHINEYIQLFGVKASLNENENDHQKPMHGMVLLDQENKVFWADKIAKKLLEFKVSHKSRVVDFFN